MLQYDKILVTSFSHVFNSINVQLLGQDYLTIVYPILHHADLRHVGDFTHFLKFVNHHQDGFLHHAQMYFRKS